MTECTEVPETQNNHADSLTLLDLQDMSLDEILLNRDRLPPDIDADSLTEETFSDFKFYLHVINTDSKRKEISPFLDENSKKYYKSGYGGLIPVLGIHEGLHGLAAELTGSHVNGGGVWALGAYIDIDFTSRLSEALSVWAPNIVLPTIGFSLLRHGMKNKDYNYIGFGTMTLLMNSESFLIDFGDYSMMTQYLFPGTHGIPLVALGAGVTFSNYLLAYGLSKGLDKTKDVVVNYLDGQEKSAN